MTQTLVTRRTLLRAGGLAAAAVAGGSALGACSGPGVAGSSKLSFYSSLTGSKEAAGTALVEAFKAANPGVEVEVTLLADLADSNTKVLTAIASGNVPDIVFNHYYFATNYASGGHLLDLNDKLAEGPLTKAALDASLLGSGEWDGKQISVPMYASSRVLLYNTALVKKAGLDPSKPPTSWEDLREWVTELTIRQGGTLKQAGILLTPPPTEAGQNLFALLLWGAGGELLSADNKTAAFNSDAGRQALTFWHQLIHQDKVFDIGFTGGPGGTDPFIAGTTAMTVGLNPTAFFAKKGGLDFGAMPFPGREQGTISLSDPLSLYIMKNGKNNDLAWKFLQFALSEEQQVKFCAATLNLPGLTSAQEAPEIVGQKEITPFIDALEVAKPLPIIPTYTEFWDALSTNLEAALSNKKSVTVALADAEQAANVILSRA